MYVPMNYLHNAQNWRADWKKRFCIIKSNEVFILPALDVEHPQNPMNSDTYLLNTF